MSAPTGRPLASSHAHEITRSWAASEPATAPKDPPASVVFSRVSARRLEAIAASLSADETAAMVFLAEVRLATGFQIARRLWAAAAPTDPRARSARRTLTRLEQLRVIERLGRRMGGVRGGSTSIVYGLGPAGRRLAERQGQAGKLGTPGERYVRHTLTITELVVRLHEATLRGELDALQAQTEPSCWRPFAGPLGARVVLKPDLFVRVKAGTQEDRWFVEVDRATEALGTLEAKARRYLAHVRSGSEQHAHGVYPRVIWAVPDRRRRDQLHYVLGRLPEPAGRLFSVWLFDEVVGRLAMEARS